MEGKNNFFNQFAFLVCTYLRDNRERGNKEKREGQKFAPMLQCSKGVNKKMSGGRCRQKNECSKISLGAFLKSVKS